MCEMSRVQKNGITISNRIAVRDNGNWHYTHMYVYFVRTIFNLQFGLPQGITQTWEKLDL